MKQELIEALATHCDFYVGNEWYMESPEEKQRIWTEKFAELIVRECAKFMDENSGYNDSNGCWFPEPEAMLKHFGVEVIGSNENTVGHIIDPGPASSKEIQDARNDCLDGTL